MALFDASLLNPANMRRVHHLLVLLLVSVFGFEPTRRAYSQMLGEDARVSSADQAESSPSRLRALLRRAGQPTVMHSAERQSSASASSDDGISRSSQRLIPVHWKDEFCGPYTPGLHPVPHNRATILEILCGFESRPTVPAKTQHFRQVFIHYPDAMMPFVLEAHPRFRHTLYGNSPGGQRGPNLQHRYSPLHARPTITPDTFQRVLASMGDRAGREASDLVRMARTAGEARRLAHPEDHHLGHHRPGDQRSSERKSVSI